MEITASYEPGGGERWRDPFARYAALRDHDPVHHVAQGDFWVLSRFADVFRAARDTSTFSSAQGLTTTYDDMAKAGLDEVAPMVMLDPPDHTAFRRLVGRGFTPRAVRTIEDDVRSFVAARIDRLREAGGGDVVAEVFKPLPSFVVAHYLGVPASDRDRFDAWTEAIVAANAGGDVTSAPDAVGELFGYFSDLIERRRADPGDDPVSALVHATLADGEAVPALQILGFAFTMVTGGNDTTTGLLGGAAEILTDRPDQRQLLLDDPGRIAVAVEEMLRLTTPVQGLARTTTSPVSVAVDGADVTIPADKKVLLLYAAANRDEREFGPSAASCDITRPIGHLLSFGSGAHHCLGAAAARLQARVALEELLARCPAFTVDASAGRFAGGAHVRRYESLPFSPG